MNLVPSTCTLAALLSLVACTPEDQVKESASDAIGETGTESDTPGETGGDSETGVGEPDRIEINDLLRLTDGRPEHLLVLTVDTLRRDRVNYHGYSERTVTPTIDRMHEEGVALLDHRSCSSWTLPSFLCALTGHDQLTLGWWPANNDGLPQPTPDEIELMAEYFEEEGFYTILEGASGFLGESTNMDQGYATGSSEFGDEAVQETGGITAPELVDAALEALAERPADQPVMMHLHFIDPHMPYVATDEILEDFGIDELSPTEFDYDTESGTLQAWIAIIENMGDAAREVQIDHMELRYDGEILLADQEIARFLESEEFGAIRDETLVVFYSDHGEEFFEHGNFNHGHSLFGEQVQVPSALWWPGRLEAVAVEELTIHEDLMPTIFALFGMEDPGFSGRIIGSGDAPAYTMKDVYRAAETHQGVTDGQNKLMYRWDGEEVEGGPKYLYDLASDPLEQNNLYDPKDPRVIELWEQLLPRVEELAKRDSDPNAVPMDPGP